MPELVPAIEADYQRSLDLVGDADPYGGAGYLGIKDVIRAHYFIADYFYAQGKGLGGIGPKSMDILHSALFRQHISYNGVRKWKTKYDICATLFYGLVKDHPFYDANKRTAFLSLIYHLKTINLCPTVDQSELENFAVEVAENKLSKRRRFKEHLSQYHNYADACVHYISYFIKKKSRRLDKKYYTVAYREFNKLLNRFGYDLQNPHNNYIDVVRIEERRKILGIFGPSEKVNVRVAQVGFPNWTSQVGPGAVKTVRNAAQLTPDKGIDSQTFFKDADPISILISQYETPLRRLADR